MRPFASLRGRVTALAILVAAAALTLGGMLLGSDLRSRDAVRWVYHSQDVIISLDSAVGDLREAESGLRGYLLTGSPGYLGPFDQDLTEAAALADRLIVLVADNPLQERRARALRRLARAKSDAMARAVRIARTQGVAIAVDPAARAHGKRLMDRLTHLADAFRQTERDLLAVRFEAAGARAERTRLLLLIGWPGFAILILAAALILLRSVGRPVADLLDAVERFGSGDRTARAAVERRPIEFGRLSRAYNDMADTLVEAMDRQAVAERDVARANNELSRRGRMLETRNLSIELIGEMAQRLQALRTDSEFVEVLLCFLPKILPDQAGALYVINNSRNLLMRDVIWNGPAMAPESFAPDACWGLRRGHEHVVEEPGSDVVCAHASGAYPVARRCEPVLAGGDVLGLLYVEGDLSEEARFRLDLLMENVALALVNESLRKRLREQSIRDPLTNLFNRRYMEEALTLETARALRNRTPVSVVMTDIDHFKRFNDEHGHDAGDALLCAVAAAIQSHFRDGDIVCRYGGEEFTIIAPGVAADLMAGRVEVLRRSIGDLSVDHRGKRLGPVTMSFGVDSWSEGSTRNIADMVVEADRALFRAKRLGRNRVELALAPSAALAAE